MVSDSDRQPGSPTPGDPPARRVSWRIAVALLAVALGASVAIFATNSSSPDSDIAALDSGDGGEKITQDATERPDDDSSMNDSEIEQEQGAEQPFDDESPPTASPEDDSRVEADHLPVVTEPPTDTYVMFDPAMMPEGTVYSVRFDVWGLGPEPSSIAVNVVSAEVVSDLGGEFDPSGRNIVMFGDVTVMQALDDEQEFNATATARRNGDLVVLELSDVTAAD